MVDQMYQRVNIRKGPGQPHWTEVLPLSYSTLHFSLLLKAPSKKSILSRKNSLAYALNHHLFSSFTAKLLNKYLPPTFACHLCPC